MLTDFRKVLDAIAARVGWNAGEIRSKMSRHTYCAARLQTLDQGAPVSVFTVANELGHGGDALVRRVYGHLSHVRHLSETVSTGSSSTGSDSSISSRSSAARPWRNVCQRRCQQHGRARKNGSPTRGNRNVGLLVAKWAREDLNLRTSRLSGRRRHRPLTPTNVHSTTWPLAPTASDGG